MKRYLMIKVWLFIVPLFSVVIKASENPPRRNNSREDESVITLKDVFKAGAVGGVCCGLCGGAAIYKAQGYSLPSDSSYYLKPIVMMTVIGFPISVGLYYTYRTLDNYNKKIARNAID